MRLSDEKNRLDYTLIIVRYTLLTISFLFCIQVSAQNTAYEITTFGGQSNQIAKGLVTNNNSDLYIGATFDESLTLGENEYLSSGTDDAVLFRYNLPSNDISWVVHISSIQSNDIYALGIDQNENIFLAGEFWVELDIQGRSITTKGDNPRGLFLAKFNQFGTLEWLEHLQGTGISEITNLAISKEGEILVSGFFETELSIADETTINSEVGIDGFLLKLDQEGDVIWVKEQSGLGNIRPQALDILADQSIVLGGVFNNQLIVESDTFRAASNDLDLFLLNYDQNGKFKWSKKVGGVFDENISDISINEFDNSIWLTGSFTGVLEIEETILESTGGKPDIFLLQLDSNGILLKSKRIGGNATQIPTKIFPSTNTIEIVGIYAGSWSIDGLNFPGNDFQNFSFMLELNSALEAINQQEIISNQGSVFIEDGFRSLVGKSLILGSFNTDLNIGNNKVNSDGDFDLFLITESLQTTSIQENDLADNQISIFPNPVINDKIQIQYKGFHKIRAFFIVDHAGRIIQTLNPTSSPQSVTLEKKGIFYLILNLNNGQYLQKKVIRH